MPEGSSCLFSYVRRTPATDSSLFLLVQLPLQASKAPTTAKAAASVVVAPQENSLLSDTSTTEFMKTTSQQFGLEKDVRKNRQQRFFLLRALKEHLKGTS